MIDSFNKTLNSIYLDPNQKINPLLKHTKIHRIIDITVPFLSLYAPTSMALHIGVGGFETYGLSCKTINHFRQSDWRSGCQESCHLVVVATSIALSIILPKINVLVSQIFHLLQLSYRLQKQIRNSEWKNAGKICLKMLSAAVYLSSVIYKRTEMIALSLLIQVLEELYQSLQQFRLSLIPEGIAKVIMANLRIYQGRSHFQKIYHKYFPETLAESIPKKILINKEHLLQQNHLNSQKVANKKLEVVEKKQSILEEIQTNQEPIQQDFNQTKNDTQNNPEVVVEQSVCNETLVETTKTAPPTSSTSRTVQPLTLQKLKKFINSDEISLANFLKTRNLSNDINGLKFKYTLNSKQIDHVNLTNCEFSGRSIDTLFKDVHFTNCSFENYLFFSSFFQKCEFVKSNFTNTVLHECWFDDVQFLDSDFTGAYFNDSIMEKVKYIACKLLETNFCGVKASHSAIIDSDLTDCLLAGTKKQFHIQGGNPHKFTKPVIGLAWDLREPLTFSTYIEKALKQENVIIMKFHFTPTSVNVKELSLEVNSQIANIHSEPVESRLSLADELLKRASPDSEIGRILDYTQEILEHVDALVLPGGNDVEQLFYKDKKDKRKKRTSSILNEIWRPFLQQNLRNNNVVQQPNKTYTDSSLSLGENLISDSDSDWQTDSGESFSDSDWDSEIDDAFDEISKDYRRTTVELALVKRANEIHKPTMGICRGAQLANVYFGGTIKNVEEHNYKLHNLKIEDSLPIETKAFAQSLAKTDHLVGISMHHQAVDKIGQKLQVVMKVDDVPKFLVSANQNFVLTQFHPEFSSICREVDCSRLVEEAKKNNVYFDMSVDGQKNQQFFTHLVEQAKKQQASTSN